MKRHKSFKPLLLYSGISEDGYQVSSWLYKRLPEGVRRAVSIDELYEGCPFLYRTWRGEYISDIFRPATEDFVRARLKKGMQIFIK